VVGQGAHGSLRGSGIAVSLVSIVIAAVVGLLVAERRRERQREGRLLAENAAAAERVRIARELHDVVAHHLSVMVVQARVLADTAAEGEPSDSARAIVDSGRRALNEMRRILGVLRSGDAPDGQRPAPRPGLAHLGALVDAVSQAGVRVDVQIEGEERELPDGLDLSAYRIVQEALTNTLRHAHATQAEVVISYARDRLELRVRDNGAGASDGAEVESGHGLAGMRERVAMFGGQLCAGPADDQGYRVRAVLPL
jgi:signal transduction histidine kinase